MRDAKVQLHVRPLPRSADSKSDRRLRWGLRYLHEVKNGARLTRLRRQTGGAAVRSLCDVCHRPTAGGAVSRGAGMFVPRGRTLTTLGEPPADSMYSSDE